MMTRAENLSATLTLLIITSAHPDTAETARLLGASRTIETVIGSRSFGYTGDGGLATKASISYVESIAFDASGNTFIADLGNNVVRMVDKSTGVITSVAGTGRFGNSGDGGPATLADLGYPTSIAFDTSGNLYIVSGPYGVVRMVTMSTGIISTVAGSNIYGYGNANIGDGGPATSAYLGFPYSIAIDKLNNMYISDLDMSRIRKVVLSTGIISTVAGSGNNRNFFFGNGNADNGDGGPATSATLGYIGFMAVDPSSGNLYFPDVFSSRIRMVDMSTGIISTVAGGSYGFTGGYYGFTGGSYGYTGDGGPATSASLFFPFGVAVDKVGNLFISDTYNHVVRFVEKSTGLISTVAGTGNFGDSGDGGPATSASFYYPFGIAVDASGAVYVADVGDSVIRAFSTVHHSVDFLGCTSLVLQAQAAITFGGAHTAITGDIGISPGTSITGDYAIGNNGMTHINEGPSLACAMDMGTIAAQAAALPCMNIPAELGKDNGAFCVFAILLC